MMRRWAESYTYKSSIAPIATMSTIVHLIVIAMWVVATLPAKGLPITSFENRVYFIPPPDRVPGSARPHEVIRFLALTPQGVPNETPARTVGNEPPPPNVGTDTVQVSSAVDSLAASSGTEDSVFTVLEVDTAVVRSSNSAAPTYPPLLLHARIGGLVSVRYVVDTTGLADPESFEVLTSTHPDFAAAVRAALPNMRFHPAKIGDLKVRQLVEQQFAFRVTDPDSAKPAPAVRKPD